MAWPMSPRPQAVPLARLARSLARARLEHHPHGEPEVLGAQVQRATGGQLLQRLPGLATWKSAGAFGIGGAALVVEGHAQQ